MDMDSGIWVSEKENCTSESKRAPDEYPWRWPTCKKADCTSSREKESEEANASQKTLIHAEVRNSGEADNR
jgi:hypothetical protein